MERSHNSVYRKVAIKNSYYVEDLPDGTKRIIYQPCIYICTTNVKDLTVIEFDKPADDIIDNVPSVSSRDNNSLPSLLAPVEQIAMDAESAAAIANTLPEIIKNLEQEEVIKSATNALRNTNLQAKTVSAKVVNVNQNASISENDILVINLNGLSNYENLQMQTLISNENQDKDKSVVDLDELSNDVSLQTELETSNDEVSNSNKENLVANVDTSQSNKLEPEKSLSMKRSSKDSNNLIKMYCNKCQVLSSSVTNYNCSTCQSLLVFQCINCTQSFETYAMVENHVKFECDMKPVFKCSKCNYESTNKYNYTRHFKRHSNSVKNVELRAERRLSLACKWCRHEYPNKTILCKHQRRCPSKIISASNKQCPHCPYKSGTPQAIQFHIFTKHQEYISEKYKCAVCGVKYRHDASLTRHMTKAHNKEYQGNLYQCDYCGVHFTSKYNLSRHMRALHASLF